MRELNRYGFLRLQFLKTVKTDLLEKMRNAGTLETHLMESQRLAQLEFEQMVFAGVNEAKADRLVLEEYIQSRE
jgi:hypothetical protein